MKRRKRKAIGRAPSPVSAEGWIEESPGVYVARESAKPFFPSSDPVAERVKEQEGAFEVLPTGKVLIFYGVDDPDAPFSTKDVKPAELVKESEAIRDPSEYEPSCQDTTNDPGTGMNDDE